MSRFSTAMERHSRFAFKTREDGRAPLAARSCMRSLLTALSRRHHEPAAGYPGALAIAGARVRTDVGPASSARLGEMTGS